MTTITARKAAIRISIRRQNASMTRVTPPPSSGQMLASNDDSPSLRRGGYCPYGEPRAPARAFQSAGNGRHRIHRIRDQPAAGLRRPAAAHGLRAARAPPLARGAALSAGPDEPDRQLAWRGHRHADGIGGGSFPARVPLPATTISLPLLPVYVGARPHDAEPTFW